MSAPSKLTPDCSGVYHTPPNVPELRGQAAAAGAEWLDTELSTVRDKAGLLAALAATLRVPAGFGANWDALADSLQDLSWRPAAAYVLHLRHAGPARQALGPEWDKLIEVLRLSARGWRGRGKPFVAIVDGAQELPAWP